MQQPNPRADRRHLLFLAGGGLVALAFGGAGRTEAAQRFPYRLSDAAWKRKLTPEQYRVLREGGTERPFSSPLDREKREGVFRCAGCDHPLFLSRTKFDSGTGWPSFYAPRPQAIALEADNSLGMRRTEVLCRRCGGHLGHVFDDGPPPTGKRYCMNGAAMTFSAT
ncbi:peptide-methionine (R)-S-oxide reductase MsrB [Sphingomonas baiyangensis]|uniref:peptide-methionine (R)-S-oxide reductase n=1 Tax=Sphingomonas baiyangensis TaxID=2572576 RepID=A0A4U1L2A7_9SPHN|nr:peptide-methionine (R)-S-oxide reductase MsrB [Sphingomonas baiyangensis]TKD50614.1 peptide-methionine (R)-S-oxide reductase MsrB [Sphingomonas baiyangensis]